MRSLIVVMCVAPVAMLLAPAGVVAQPEAAVAPDAEAVWSAAVDALVGGDLAAARAGFERVAADESVAPERRAAAHDLAERIARRQAEPPAAAPAVAAPDKAAQPPMESEDRAGRALLVGASTAMGLGIWGWSLPTALDIENDRGYIGLYMVTAGASFGAPFLLTRHNRATWGMANMTWLGGTRGALAGLGTSMLINGESDDVPATGLFVGSVLGTAAATVWADRADMTPGVAHATGNGSDVGMLSGLAAAYLTNLDGHDRSGDSSDDAGVRWRASFMLAGGLLGGAGAHALALRRDLTWGDAEVMRLPSALGVDAAATVAIWADADVDMGRPLIGGLLVGGLAGTAVGEYLVRGHDFGVGQGLLLDLGTVAGALGAMGSFYLITGESSARAFVTSSLVGGTAVFTSLYLTLDSPTSRRVARAMERHRPGTQASFLPLLGAQGARGVAWGGLF